MQEDQSHGEVKALASAVHVTERFTRKVILAVKTGTEKELFIRKRKKSAVGEDLRKDLEEFLLQQRISRNCPGETVSIGYGQRKEKCDEYMQRSSSQRIYTSTENKVYIEDLTTVLAS